MGKIVLVACLLEALIGPYRANSTELKAETGLQAPAPAAPDSPPPAEIGFAHLHPDAVIATGLEAGAVATPDALWLLKRAAGTIVRIDPVTNAADKPIAVGNGPCASLAVAFDSVWVPLCGDRTMARVDPKAGKVSATAGLATADPDGSIAAGVGSLWVLTERRGVLTRVDPDTNTVVAEAFVAPDAFAVVFGDNALWVTSEHDQSLTRLDPHTNVVVDTIKVGPRPGRLAIGEGAVWVLNRGDGSVTRVDPKTNKTEATIAIGMSSANGEIAAGEGSVWISATGVPIVRIDPRTNRVAQRFTGDGGGAIVVGHGSLWVAAGPETTWRLDPLLVSTMRPE